MSIKDYEKYTMRLLSEGSAIGTETIWKDRGGQNIRRAESSRLVFVGWSIIHHSPKKDSRSTRWEDAGNGKRGGSISFGFQFLFSNGLVRCSISRDGISRLSSHAASLGEPSGVRARFDSLTLACGDVSDAPVFSTCNLRTASNARSIANRIKTLSLLYLYVSSS